MECLRTRHFWIILTIACVLTNLNNVGTSFAPILSSTANETLATTDNPLFVATSNQKGYAVTSDQSNSTTRCKYDLDPTLLHMNETLRQKCCDDLYAVFEYYWYHSNIKLGDLLRAMRTWRCPQFEEECASPTFAYTEFTKLVYDRFCEPEEYEKKCEGDVRDVVRVDSIESLNSTLSDSTEGSGWVISELIASSSSLFPTSSRESDMRNDPWMDKVHAGHLRADLTLEEQLKPCVQAALINTHRVSEGSYFEIKENEIAFCGIIWCAFRTDTYRTQDISDATCMQKRCVLGTYIMMAAAGVLGLAIVLTNSTVLIVFGMNPRLMNSQGIYKMSLAAADLLVGLFVFPTFIETIRRGYHSRYVIQEVDFVEYSWNSGRNGTRLVPRGYDPSFFGFAGFFTTLSLAVSMYTLMIASFDRLLVVYRPLEYNQFRARGVAKKCTSVLWILGIVFSILPLFIPGLRYMRVASLLVSLGGGTTALILYTVAFAIPLVLVWSVNIATFTFSKKNASVRPKVRISESVTLSVNLETQLAKTLSIMVGVFSLCILPVASILIAELFIGGIYYGDPKNMNVTTTTIVISIEAVAAFILMSNSLWNFFIYNARSQEFRAAFRSVFRRFLFCYRRNVYCGKCHKTDHRASVNSHSFSNINSNKNRTLSSRVRVSGHTV